MKLFYRLLTMLLAICLVVGMIPATVNATGNPEVTADSGNMTMESTNSFGYLLSEDLQQEQAEEEENATDGYNVIGLTVEGNTAVVEYASLEEAVLVVALYTEDGMQMLCSGKTIVDPEATEATVAIEGEMPEYFMAAAYLVDTYDYSPLCEAYNTPMYTKEMQELLASNVDDYDEELVLNFDEDETTNFAVFAEGVKIIDYAEGVNTVISADDENATYVIGNADSNITSLQSGDVFAYTYGEEQLMIVKVASLSIEGDTATIHGEDVEMEEVFSHVKMEQTADAADMEVDPTKCTEGVTYEGMQEGSSPYGLQRASGLEGDFGQKNSYHYKFLDAPLLDEDGKYGEASIKITGTIGIILDVSFNYYVSFTRQFIEFKTDVGIKATIKIEGAVKGKIPLGDISLKGYGLSLGFEPVFQIEVKASMELSFFAGFTFGLSFENKKGFHNLTGKPKIEADFKVEGSIFIGIDFAPTFKVAEGILAEAKVEVPLGFELKAELKGTDFEPVVLNAESIHDCKKCVDMELRFKFKVSAKLQFLKNKRLGIESDVMHRSVKIADLYWSIDRGEFCWAATCPYQKYRTTVAVRDVQGKPVANTEVTAQGDKDLSIISLGNTNKNGVVTGYLSPDHYCFSAIVAEETLSEEQKVQGACKILLGNVLGEASVLDGIVPDEIIDHGYVVASGNAGMNSPGDIIWTLYSSGLFHMQGSGNMTSLPEWDDYRSQITSVVIEEGITSVGGWAFEECENLAEVKLPNTIKYIDASAFLGCSKLKEIDIPNSVTFIGQSAFRECASLKNIEIPSSVKEIWAYAFQDCTALERIAIPDKITYIDNWMFAGCYNLSDVYIPSSVTSIGNYAFRDCILLTEVDIPDYVSCIGEYAFYGCYNLQSIVIPEGVSRIEDSTFAECNRLTSITIPDGVTSIDRYAFLDCVSLSEIPLPSKLTYIGYGAFANCSNWSGDIVVPNGVTSVERNAFNRCSNLTSIQLPEGLTNIGQATFAGCEKLRQINIPSSVTSIGKAAFDSCRSLETICIPDGVTRIEDTTFNCCRGLTDIEIPIGVTSIGEDAFFACLSLAEITLPSSLTSIGQSAFYGCDKLTEIIIPDGVANIPTSAFHTCTGLKSVTIPASVTSIGYTAFAGCTALSDIYYGGTQEQWSNIQIDTSNDAVFTQATKHFANTAAVISEPVLAAPEVTEEKSVEEMQEIQTEQQDVPTLDAVFGGEYGTEVTPEYTLKTASFSGLVPGEQYVLLAMASIEAENVLDAENLLYISQKTAEEDGTLVFTYVQRIDTGLSYVIACGASNKNLKEAVITFQKMTADEEAQTVNPTVTYDGEELTEGIDYVIVGKADFAEAGTYTCKIRGIRNYTGIVTCTYTVMESFLLGDVNSDGVVNAHDRVYLARYLAKWTDYPASVINMDAADVNGDGVVNAHDRVYLARHLAKWSGYETLGA